MEPIRRTKIIATLGPATRDEAMLRRIIQAGVDVIRLNFSHTLDNVAHIVDLIRRLASEAEREVAILADLQGPKIRIGEFKSGSITLQPGAVFTLDADLAIDAGTQASVGLDYKALVNDVTTGDQLILDDGRIVLKITEIKDRKIICAVIEGGVLSNHKGINLAGGGLSAPALTEKDKTDLKVAAQLNVDYIAFSFVRDANDIHVARQLMINAQCNASLITKIERAEALEHTDAIIMASDAVMVARGDLGVEIGDARLPGVQKHIINRARALNKVVITATQMMESMINNPVPTRAEVFDVGNAVLDGTDAVMLSAESAIGHYPDKAIEAMVRICMGAELERISQVSGHRIESRFESVDEAIAMATMYTANHLKVKAIIALTETGKTPLWMSRMRSSIPIFALCRHAHIRRKMMLYRGVVPLAFDVTTFSRDDLNSSAVNLLERKNVVELGDLVILTKGDYMGVEGGANAMKIVKVGAVV